MSGKRYVLSHRSWWHRTNGHTVNTVRVFDMTEGEIITSARWTGSPSISSIYARAEEAIGRPIGSSEAWVESVEVSARARLHRA